MHDEAEFPVVGIDDISEEEYNKLKEKTMPKKKKKKKIVKKKKKKTKKKRKQMSVKAVKKLRKLKDELDKVHEKEDDLLFKIDEVIDELEDPNGDQDVEPR